MPCNVGSFCVHTVGNQNYEAGLTSGKFNGTYISSGGDIHLLGAGTAGVVLSLTGDTQIDVARVSVQKGSSVSYGNIITRIAKPTIQAGNITVSRYWC